MNKYNDYTNTVIGNWRVLELAKGKRLRRSMVWTCLCLVCKQALKENSGQALGRKPPNSCGCAGKNRKRPFEALYNRLRYECRWNRRARPVLFSYDEFLQFTEETRCHYCWSEIVWRMFNLKGHSAYNLDRKDNTLPYITDNCVVCCERCNKAKSDKFTYAEWYGMTAYFRIKS